MTQVQAIANSELTVIVYLVVKHVLYCQLRDLQPYNGSWKNYKYCTHKQ